MIIFYGFLIECSIRQRRTIDMSFNKIYVSSNIKIKQ